MKEARKIESAVSRDRSGTAAVANPTGSFSTPPRACRSPIAVSIATHSWLVLVNLQTTCAAMQMSKSSVPTPSPLAHRRIQPSASHRTGGSTGSQAASVNGSSTDVDHLSRLQATGSTLRHSHVVS